MIRVLPVMLLGITVLAAGAGAVSAGSPEDVQTLVGRAAEHIRDVGREQAFADFTRPDGGFVEGELYVFCSDTKGIQLANGGNPKLVGKNLSFARDAQGRTTNVELHRIGQTKGQGWYEYFWPNPAKARVERKIVYVVRVDDETICASGYYKPDQSETDKPAAGKPGTDKPGMGKP